MRLTYRIAGRKAPTAFLPGHRSGGVFIALAILLLLTLMLSGSPLQAAEAPAAAVSAELLETKIKEVQASGGLDEATRNSLIELYRKAQSELEATRGFEESLKTFGKAQESALRQTGDLRKSLAQPAPKASLQALGVSAQTPAAQLQQVLIAQQGDQSAAETRLDEIDAQVRQLISRPPEAHQRLAEARRQLDDIATSLVTPPVSGEAPALTEARGWLLQIRQRSLQAETVSYTHLTLPTN